jgi:hypothetical protein
MGKTVLTKSLGAITVNEVKTNKCGVIPKNTELTEVWEASMWDGVSLVIYNGCEEFISTFKSSEIFIYSIPAEIVTSGKTTFTDVADGKTTELPSGTKATLIAQYGGTISGGETLYVNYNNVKGWLKTTEESSYEYVNGYPSEAEWVNDTDPVSDDNPDEAPVSSSDDNPDTTGDVAPPDPKPDQDQKEETKDNKSKGFNKLAIIIMCCIGAFAVAIAAVVTIILVNVGKKNKKAPAPAPAVVPEPEKTEPVNEEVEEEPALEEKPEPAPFPVKPVEDPEEKQKNEEKDNQ